MVSVPARVLIPALCALSGLLISTIIIGLSYDAGTTSVIKASSDIVRDWLLLAGQPFEHQLNATASLALGISKQFVHRSFAVDEPFTLEGEPWYHPLSTVLLHAFRWGGHPLVVAVQLDDGSVVRIANMSDSSTYGVAVRDTTSGDAVLHFSQYWSGNNTKMQLPTEGPWNLLDPRLNPNCLAAKAKLWAFSARSVWGPLTTTSYTPSLMAISSYVAIYNKTRTFIGLSQVTLYVGWFSQLLHFSEKMANVFLVDNEQYLLASSQTPFLLTVLNVSTNFSGSIPAGCTLSVATPYQLMCRIHVDNFSYAPLRAAKPLILSPQNIIGATVRSEGATYIVGTRHLATPLDVQPNFTLVIIVSQDDLIREFSDARLVDIVGAVVLIVATVSLCGAITYYLLSPLHDLAVALPSIANLDAVPSDMTLSAVPEVCDVQKAYLALTKRLSLLRKFVPHSVFTKERQPLLVESLATPVTGECTVDFNRINQPRNSFRLCSCTMLHVEAFNMETTMAWRKSEDVSMFLLPVLEAIKFCGGVVELMFPPHVIASFNAHGSCSMHEYAAVTCALQIQEKLLRTPLRFVISIDSSDCSVGNCGTGNSNAQVVMGEAVDLVYKLSRLQRNHVGRHLIMTERVAEGISRQQLDLLPVDTISPLWDQADRSTRLILFFVPQRIPHSPSGGRARQRRIFLQSLHEQYVRIVSGKSKVDENRKSPELEDPDIEQYVHYLDTLRKHGGPNVSYVRRETSYWEHFAWDRSLIVKSCVPTTRAEEAEQQTQKLREAMIPVPLIDHGIIVPGEPSADEPLPFPEFSSVLESMERDNQSSEPDSTNPAAGEPLAVQTINGDVWRRSATPLGRGSYGTVYWGLSDKGQVAAMKFLMLQSNVADLSALEGELVTMMTIKHINVVTYISSSITPSYLVIVMEYLAGGSLNDLLLQFGAIDPESVRRFASNILHGLEQLHQHGIIHCDIKPANVLLGSSGVCKLTDFGSIVNCKQARVGDIDVFGLKGTPLYMAPEVALGGDPTEASDVWSFGITVLELLMGKNPWGSQTKGFFSRFTHDTTFMPEIPEALPYHDIIKQCLSRSALQRPTVVELLLQFAG